MPPRGALSLVLLPLFILYCLASMCREFCRHPGQSDVVKLIPRALRHVYPLDLVATYCPLRLVWNPHLRAIIFRSFRACSDRRWFVLSFLRSLLRRSSPLLFPTRAKKNFPNCFSPFFQSFVFKLYLRRTLMDASASVNAYFAMFFLDVQACPSFLSTPP